MDGAIKLSERDFFIGFAKNPPTYFDDAPDDNKLNSDVWKNLRIIRHTETKLKVKDWYKCTELGCPSPFLECSVSNGNAKLRRHMDSHKKMKPYTLSSSNLCEAFSAISGLGAKYGKISTDVLNQFMPPSSTENWTIFLEKVECHLNCQSTTTLENTNRPITDEQSIVSNTKPSCSGSHENRIEMANKTNSFQFAMTMSTDAMARINIRSKS